MSSTLSAFGLMPLGAWNRGDYASVAHLRPHCPFGISFDVPREWRTKASVVYAFAVDDSVLYVGETTRGMASRFEGYRYGNPNPKDTDNRVKLAITQNLAAGRPVSIWGGQPVARFQLPSGEVLHVPACKPLEEHLIAMLQPPLNVKSIHQPVATQ